MLELNWFFFAIAGPAVIFAGISKGGFGSGASFAAAVFLALVIDPSLALGVMLPLLMLIDLATLRPYWKQWLGRPALLLILGSIPGAALGAYLFAWTNEDMLRVLIGAIALGFVVWQFLQRRQALPVASTTLPNWTGLLAGAVAGFTSFVSHAGGPPAAVYLLSLRPTKTAYQATSVIVFFSINIAKFIPYAGLGMFTADTFKANLALAPFALFGAWLGVKMHRMMPERWFFAFTYVALTLTGLRLIWVGLT